MQDSRRVWIVSALSLLLVGPVVRTATPAETIPPDSAFAKANPGWQRLLLAIMRPGAPVGVGGDQMQDLTAKPSADVKTGAGAPAMEFAARANVPEAKGDYTLAKNVAGEVKMLGMWAYLPPNANVARVAFQLFDNEGECFARAFDANWTGWKWLEADLTAGQFTQAYKQTDKNGKIDSPLRSVGVTWFARQAGPSAICVDNLLAVSDMGDRAAPIPVEATAPPEVTLETAGKLSAPVVLTNTTDKPVTAEMEFLVQQDPALYSKPAPHPLYGVDIATGKKSWVECEGKVYQDNSLTDGKSWTEFASPWHNDKSLKEMFAYVDLGSSVRVTHLSFGPCDASWIWKVDFAASADGKEYRPIEGLQGRDFHLKWGPQDVPVPQPFEARFLRLRLHNDGEGVIAFHLPTEIHIFANTTEDMWALPKTGTTLLQGKLTETIPARRFGVAEIGDGRTLGPGAYLVAVRTRAAGLTQLTYQHLFVMPVAMAKVTRSSRFGINGIELPKLAVREGNGWVRFENLKWPFVSPAPGVYAFDGSVGPWHVRHDDIFRGYHDAGMSTVPYLFLTPGYLVPKNPKGDGMTNPPTDLSKYAEFVYQTVARYGSKKHPPEDLLTNDKVSGLGYIDTYELWNEPDLNDPNWGSWKGPLDDYYTMFRFGAEAAKKADPSVTVTNAGWSGMDVPLMETMRTHKYPDGKCPLDFTDALSVHYYSFRVEPERARLDDNTYRDGAPDDRNTFEQDLDLLVAWRDRVKPKMPIWLTETGYDSGGPRGVDERLQAGWLVRDMMMTLASGIDKVFLFRERGSGDALFAASGVIRDDYSLKPSFFTYATLIRQLDGVTARALKVPFADDNVRMYLWKRGDRAILTAWAIQGAARLNVRLGRCTVTDAFGMPQKADVEQSLELTDFPVYITDFADPTVTKALEEQALAGIAKEQRRLERLNQAQTYLFDFGSMDRVGTLKLAPGIERKFTPVVAADRYSEARGYGFEAQFADRVLGDKVEAWRRNPLTEDEVMLSGGARFTFNTRPGEYVLQIGARPEKESQMILHGLDGGDRTLELHTTSETFTATVKVGSRPVTLETGPGFYGALCWMSMVPVIP